MQRVQIGTRVKRLGINRLSIGEGMVGRALLLDPNPQMKYIAYDEANKKRVEVDQDMVLKYGLRPSTTFYYLVAKLNTDLNGNVIGDKFTIEYLQLSENLNNELSDLIAEQGMLKSLQLTKVKKTGEQGRDYSYIKAIPSQKDFSENQLLWNNINKVKSNQEFIDKCWQLIDADTSLNKVQYENFLQSLGNQAMSQTKALSQQKQIQPTQAPQITQQPPAQEQSTSFEEANSFGEGFEDSFADDFAGM